MIFGKHINRYYLRYSYLFIIGILTLIAIDWIQLYIPEYLGQIVDLFTVDYVANEIYKTVLDISLKILVISFGLMLGRILWRLTLFSASKRIEADIRRKMFEKAEKLSRQYYQDNKVGTILSWFTSDTETIEEYFSWGTLMMVDAIFLSIFSIIKMVRLNVLLSLLSFIPLVLIIIWGALVEKFMSKMWTKRQEANDKIYDFANENFTGIRVIKAFVKERQEMHRFAKIAKENKDINIKFVRVDVIFEAIISILIALMIVLVVGFGGYLVYLSIYDNPLSFTIFNYNYVAELKVGNLVTFIGYLDTLIWPMIALGQVIAMRARAKASLGRISNFLDAEEDVKSKEDAVKLTNVQGKIEFKELSFKYPSGNYDSLKNVSLVINPGDKIGIIGRIGSGKTTIASLLTRLYNFAPKSIYIDDVDLMDVDIDSLRENIAYAPQDNFLFSDTIKNNIAFSNEELGMDDVKDAARFAAIDTDIEHFEKKYETVSGERGVTLSGGQKQRIALARAYLKHSPIMILDDSFSAVDLSTEEEMLNNLKNLPNKQTLLVIASRVSTVSHLDKIIVLNDGAVEAFDTPKNLMKISPTYQKMVMSQKLEQELKEGE
ncbi:MAG: ABC transporter ATP-binding protein/permease [Bacilli bacterium]|nr:ABC transporter ATP-binding protein/permease [Bacilli bacterium]